MQRIDVLIVGALVLAAAGSLVGVLAYEDDRLAEFAIEWTLASAEAEGERVPHNGAGEVETSVEIRESNVTRITFVVTIGGGPARVQPTAILVEVVSPTNESISVEGELPVGPTATVDIPVEVELAPVPDATSVSGPTLDDARRALNATLSSSLGIGTWTIRASFAPSAPGPLGGQEAHTVAALARIERYEATLSAISPEVGR